MIELDRSSTIREHIGELHRLARISAIIFCILCVFWSFFVGRIVSTWLQMIPIDKDPNNANLSIYAPFDWIQMRWEIVIMLSLISLLPILSIQFYRFSRHGLFTEERKWLVAVLVFSTTGAPIMILAVWTIGLPAIFNLAYQIGTPGTVGIRYDARSLFSLAIGLSWVLVIWSVTMVALTMTRVFGLVSNGKSRFRNRILAISAGTLMLSLPVEYDGLRILISISVVFIADFLSRLAQIPISGVRDSVINDASP